MIFEMINNSIVLVRHLFIMSFFAEPVCDDESLQTRTILIDLAIYKYNFNPIYDPEASIGSSRSVDLLRLRWNDHIH